MTIFLPTRVTFEYKGEIFDNTEFHEGVFLKGGCAREALMAYMAGDRDITIRPRDLDMWVPDWMEEEEDRGEWYWENEKNVWEWYWEDLNECPLIGNFYWSEDSRFYWADDSMAYWDHRLEPYGVASRILRNKVDVNINKVLLGRDGIYAHEDAVKGILNEEVKRDCPLKAPKRAIRAYLMALRYNYSINHYMTYLPMEPHSYYLVAMKKANELGIMSDWVELLKYFKVWVYYKEALKIYGHQEEDIPLIVVED